MRGTITGLALALVTSLAGSPTPAEGAAVPMARLRLTVIDESRPVPVSRWVSLTCDPAGGTHPRAVEACRELHLNLAPIAGRPADAITGLTARCTTEYAPRTILAEGHWSRRAIRHRADYGNDCLLRAATGTVYQF